MDGDGLISSTEIKLFLEDPLSMCLSPKQKKNLANKFTYSNSTFLDFDEFEDFVIFIFSN